jgi:hypothetical protein
MSPESAAISVERIRTIVGAVGAEERDDRSLGEGEVDAIEHDGLAERLPDGAHDDGWVTRVGRECLCW